ncbi:MAG: nitric oxide reductase activation protein [Gammaproteobacteria bacterium]|nr:nitric oxide reductase activation protein [Gammaproteobacteria bacterium]
MATPGDQTNTQDALTVAELEDRLDEMLDAVLSIRRSTTAAATALARLARPDQDYACHWVEVIAKTNPELAFHFASHVTAALTRMRSEDREAWIIEAMDTYDRLGLYPAVAILADAESFAAARDGQARTATLETTAPMLELFLQALSGRRLKIAPGERIYTDTTTLFLPARLAILPTREANRMLYKIMATHLWAQGWFGTFRKDPLSLRSEWERYAEPERAARLFYALETIRLDACLERELPGLYRELRTLRADAPPQWADAGRRLAQKDASVEDTQRAVAALYEGPLPQAQIYQGILDLDAVAQAMNERIEQERAALRNALGKLAREHAGMAPQERQFTVSNDPGPEGTVQLMLDGQPLVTPPDVQNLMKSIVQDLGDIPDEYLVAAGDGGYAPDGEKRADDVWKGTYHEDGAFLYNEWDHRREHYRKDWCVLREVEVHPVHDGFVADTLRKYAGLSARLRKTFEALRGENAVQKRQKNGDDIDFDALVDALADLKCGRELNDRLFLRSRRTARNIAVMFMVDMSGSTKGWINDAERESLLLLSEALEILGDRYAIYGFSGTTRKRCELYRIKEFTEPYGDPVRARISGIRPQDYTRMGVAIRHLCRLLNGVDARTKLLITLSDGKPDDYDGYRGEYGIEDTRQALLEAKRGGIHAFCITIDHDARDYLPHMYGPANYVLIDDVRKLPLKISDIYRHLTS